MRTWKITDVDEECPECGNCLEIYTDQDEGCGDDEQVRCVDVDCQYEGMIYVTEDGDTLLSEY